MAMAAQAAEETLRKELDQLRSDITALTRTLKDIAADQGGAAYEKMRRSAQGAKEEAVHAAGAVGHEIGERPFTSMLGAFSVGLLIGILFSRRS
jgi:ElaB/YqjD/DUF883 family membrane-anchored ribosome-binding protein